MDLNSILKNEQLKGMLKKYGIKESQVNSILSMAVSTLKNKFEKEPTKVSSLLSDKPNTDEDNHLAKKIDDDFVSSITKKLGLPNSVTEQIKGKAMPEIMKSVSGGLSASGKNNQDGIMSSLGGFLDAIDGDGKKNNGGGLLNKLFGMFGKK